MHTSLSTSVTGNEGLQQACCTVSVHVHLMATAETKPYNKMPLHVVSQGQATKCINGQLPEPLEMNLCPGLGDSVLNEMQESAACLGFNLGPEKRVSN